MAEVLAPKMTSPEDAVKPLTDLAAKQQAEIAPLARAATQAAGVYERATEGRDVAIKQANVSAGREYAA